MFIKVDDVIRTLTDNYKKLQAYSFKMDSFPLFWYNVDIDKYI